MSDPLVTVMMPAYNAQVFIAEAIDSVLAQTFKDWELIVIDDGSTDDTPHIVARYDDPRIRLIRQANGGESVARNTALENMRGELLAFLDSDDQFLPQHLALTVAHLQANPGNHGVYTDGYHCNSLGHRLQPLSANRRGPFTGDIFEQLVRASDVFGPPICAVLRRNLIDEHNLRFDPEIVIGPDWDFTTRYSERARFGYIAERTCLYRIHETNISVSVDRQRRAASLARCREKAIKLERFHECSLETRRAVFYDLLVEQLKGHPQRQTETMAWAEFTTLPRDVQAQLLRLVAAESILHNGTLTDRVTNWLQRANTLQPGDWRGRLLFALLQLNPQLARRLLLIKRHRQQHKSSTSPFKNVQ